MMKQSFVIISCGGIGKAYGTICREAAYEVVEKRKPQDRRFRYDTLNILIGAPFGTSIQRPI